MALYVILRSTAADGAIVAMQLQTSASGRAQWYYDRGDGYSELNSVSAPLKSGLNNISIRLPVGAYKGLRFDPINSNASVTLLSMHWTVAAEVDARLLAANRLRPVANVNIVEHGEALEIVPVEDTNDPQLQLPLPHELLLPPLRARVTDTLASAALALLIGSMFWFAAAGIGTRTLVVGGMLLAAVQIFYLSATVTTAASLHPDEYSHWPVFHYYAEHWLPPAVDDPAVLPSLSVWGYSYLYELNATYWIAAHVMAPLARLFDSELALARTFQCILWIVLCALAAGSRQRAVALGVLLLSPQVWYVFAYFNSDAFPLFAALIAVTLLIDRTSSLHAYLEGRARLGAGTMLFAAMLGLLLVCKSNYSVLVPGLLLWLAVLYLEVRWAELLGILSGLGLLGYAVFLGGAPGLHATNVLWLIKLGVFLLLAGSAIALIWRYRRWRTPGNALPRLICVAALAFGIAGPRLVWDVHVNGLPAAKAEKILAIEESHARQDLRPSVIARGEGGEFTALRTRGVSLVQMLIGFPYRWLAWSAMSAFGVYGYMNIFAPAATYVLLVLIGAGVFVMAAFALRRTFPAKSMRLLWVGAGTAALVMESSVLHSWIDAFQPQGRYLFPIFVVLALLLGAGEQALPQRALRIALAAALLVSTYSFVAVAMPSLAHAG